MEICNACRYCEGFCAVFPAMELRREFSDADLSYLANLCHNCRGCYYSCQYAPPHELGINLPGASRAARGELRRICLAAAARACFPAQRCRGVADYRGVARAVLILTMLLASRRTCSMQRIAGRGAFYRHHPALG